ncbi:MAG: 4-hydroxy-3-methylbut-2-enyl diphosphate reductase [Candidatus Amulumruptor caecigallinarius]|nr:4-hydroxy-3-methylbut-2-enyl diphosphate reductase [Candidatus Amulumruptor caecigallinarius]MCM1396094.1 4-hydroxy-3-methylbut-2-enyl diphosphate reductase [Candidatus Amulumruptor caecigallinarius]MCM1453897.1 4-hydroxy-3-methylbut-2-enyl diphosphate reductase [bacterium]
MLVRIEIDPGSGFCNGVVSAIRKAEAELSKGGILYCLGDIVHNSDEVERLRAKGLVTISHEQLAELHDAKVLLRAHGEPPSTYELARRNNIEIIDATCPVVLKLQQRIKQAYDAGGTDSTIVIYGKNGHAEVNGLVGQTAGRAIVVESVADLDAVPADRPVELYSQTTKSTEGLSLIAEGLRERLRPDVTLNTHDTVCRQVSSRVQKLRDFAAAHDAIIFVSGAKSSNGRILFNECKQVNPRTYMVSDVRAFDPDTVADAASVGICGATSTPRWLMEAVRARLAEAFSANG